ncbi:MAG: hypothetical protein K0S32_4170 [Bacteroidetes bacterium]|jgi:hypothetical protein|nr:hypothetical protein [Bacteroidota bacterium]
MKKAIKITGQLIEGGEIYYFVALAVISLFK